MTEQEIIKTLVETLVECGIPKWAIDEESNVQISCSGKASVIKSDLVVVDPSQKIPLMIFEVKDRKADLSAFYQDAKREFRYALSRGFKCFAVAQDKDGNVKIAQIREREWNEIKWYAISDGDIFPLVIGDYLLEVKRIIAQREDDAKEHKLRLFRWWVTVTGTLISATAALSESWGMEYSWKVYSLVGLIFALYTVSYGYSIRLRVGEYEVSLCAKKENDK